MAKLFRILTLLQVFILIVLRSLKVILFTRFIKEVAINHWFGSLGNNLIQIANAHFFAQKFNVSLSVPEHSFLLTRTRFSISESIVNPPLENIFTAQLFLGELKNPKGFSQLKYAFLRSFFYQFDILPFFADLNAYRVILKDLTPDLIPHKTDPLVRDETLVIHLRSGDAFASQCVHAAYVQPPLSFYQEVIEASGCRHVIVVTQSDLKNPCITSLQKSIPNLQIQTGTLEEDINTILSAKYLAVGMSSFSLTLAFCSSNLQHLYVPRLKVKPGYWRVKFWSPLLRMTCQSTALNLQGLDFKIHPIQLTNYIAIGNWQNSTQQRALMLSHSRKHLKIESL